MHTDLAWEQWGARDPYFGVLTDPRFRSDALTPEAREDFFLMGRHHVDYVMHRCRHYFNPAFTPQRVLDFGCGVGRVALPFAAVAAEVVGMDISPSMLAEAERNCRERNIANVSLVKSDDTLSAASGSFDLVHSCIVLQHIEVARGLTLFTALVDKVRPGGCGSIHITFGWDYYSSRFGQPPPPAPPTPPPRLSTRRTVQAWLRNRFRAARPRPPGPDGKPQPRDPEMQMNYYNLSEVSFILMKAGITHTVNEFTDHGGALGTTIFFQRGATPA